MDFETVLIAASPAAGFADYALGFTLWLSLVGGLCLSAIAVFAPALWSKRTGTGAAQRRGLRGFPRPVAQLHAS